MYVKGLKNSGINIFEKAGKLFPDNDIHMVSTLILKLLLIFSCCAISYHIQRNCKLKIKWHCEIHHLDASVTNAMRDCCWLCPIQYL